MTRFKMTDEDYQKYANPKPSADVIKLPAHYRHSKIETIDRIEATVAGYQDPVMAGLIWQVCKYVDRAPHKGSSLEDLKKAKQYLSRAIAKIEGRDGWE